jgi:hypothetical protein
LLDIKRVSWNLAEKHFFAKTAESEESREQQSECSLAVAISLLLLSSSPKIENIVALD